ncbi:hypothetical protein ABT093_19560 [Kitasatospora sp. NPDC002551]|uniref:hypothetical protein n=1 Tax=unclassified Kitasatospora TaxID=2633591 RepID=UPI00331FC956
MVTAQDSLFVNHAGVQDAIDYLRNEGHAMEAAMLETKSILEQHIGTDLQGAYAEAARTFATELGQLDSAMIRDIDEATKALADMHHVLWEADNHAGQGIGA